MDEQKSETQVVENKYKALLDEIYYKKLDLDGAVDIINRMVVLGCSKGVFNLNDISRITKALLIIQNCVEEKTV